MGHERGQSPEDREERDQGHHRIDEAHPEALHDAREPHGVLLHPLGRALDVAHPMPQRHVVVVHRGPPAEDVVADEEAGDHRDGDRDEGDLREREQLAEVLPDRHAVRLRQRLLDEVVEGPEPLVDHHVELHLEPGDEDDRGRSEHRPSRPLVRRVPVPEREKEHVAEDHVLVEPERPGALGGGLAGGAGRFPLALEGRVGGAGRLVRVLGQLGQLLQPRRLGGELVSEPPPQAERFPGIPRKREPERDAGNRPDREGQEEEPGFRKEGFEHGLASRSSGNGKRRLRLPPGDTSRRYNAVGGLSASGWIVRRRGASR